MNNSSYYNCNDSLSIRTEKEEEVWSLSQLLWTFCFALILVISILGNCIVLWIILAHRTMWSVTNYFLVNVTVADLLMSTLNCIPSFIFMRDRVWIFGFYYCKINNFVSYMTVSLNVFTLLAISVDRRKAIIRPLSPKSGKMSVLAVILSIWLVSGVMAAPAGYFSQQVDIRKCSDSKACILVWPDGYQGSSQLDYLYNIAFFFLTYVMPMIGMGICYIQMGRNLWRGDKSALSLLVPQVALTKSRNDKKKIVKMFAFVVVIFMVCWAPYHIYFIFSYHYPSIMRTSYIGHIYLSFYWLAMSNTCVNPIIYYYMNQRFRTYFNQVLCCVPNYISKTAKTQWTAGSQRRAKSDTQFSFIYHNQRSRRFSERTTIEVPPRAMSMNNGHHVNNFNTLPKTLETFKMRDLNGMGQMDISTNTQKATSNNLEYLDYWLTYRYRSEVLL